MSDLLSEGCLNWSRSGISPSSSSTTISSLWTYKRTGQTRLCWVKGQSSDREKQADNRREAALKAQPAECVLSVFLTVCLKPTAVC